MYPLEVWKFVLKMVTSEQVVEMPYGARILHVDMQYNTPVLWALVDPQETEADKRRFLIAETGQSIDYQRISGHISTLLLNGGRYAVHVFEMLREVEDDGAD